MKHPDGTWIDTIGYAHHAASGAVYTCRTSDLRNGIVDDIHIGMALVNESARTLILNWYHRYGYRKVVVMETEYPGSFMVKGIET
jgi:hypothetical protein